MARQGYLLLSWLARERGSSRQGDESDALIEATHTLLFDAASPYRGKVTRVLFFCHRPGEGEERRWMEALVERMREMLIEGGFERDRIAFRYLAHEAPAEPEAIFTFLKTQFEQIRIEYGDERHLLHVRLSSLQMRRLRLLLQKRGGFDGTLVRTFPPEERRGGRVTEEIALDRPDLAEGEGKTDSQVEEGAPPLLRKRGRISAGTRKEAEVTAFLRSLDPDHLRHVLRGAVSHVVRGFRLPKEEDATAHVRKRAFRGNGGASPKEEKAGAHLHSLWYMGRFRSEKLKRLAEKACRFAPLNVPILIVGERGVGKTTLASWIRRNSPYRREEQDNCWPSVSCGQYTEELMRGELFGYRKGAFTGATKNYDGLLKEADGDTLFLDEIGDISHEVQRLLIRAIEEKAYLPIGAKKSIKSDFRLITATNRKRSDLRKSLCPDFFDRIAYFVLHVPPLREIPEDIPHLWKEVFKEARRQNASSLPIPSLSPAVHEEIATRLQEMRLPGNLRDLYQLAYHLIALLGGEHPGRPEAAVEEAFALFQESQKWKNEEEGIVDLAQSQVEEILGRLKRDSDEGRFNLTDYLDTLKDHFIDQTLSRTHGNQSAAARLLGMTPQNLNAYLKRRRV